MIFYPNSTFSEDKSSLDDYLNISGECLPLEENSDSIKSKKSGASSKTNKSIKFVITPKGQKGIKTERKFREDDIRKKIKTSYFNFQRKILNANLRQSGSKKIFQTFPQFFITNITKETNYKILNMTYGKLFKHVHDKLSSVNNSIKIKKIDIKKDLKNNETLEYLASNPLISERSGWKTIKDTKCVDLLKDFFVSKEFEKSVKSMSKKESKEYVELYKYFAKNYVDYFLSYDPEKAIKTKKSKKPNKKNIPKRDSNVNKTKNPSFLMSEVTDLVGNLFSSSNHDSMGNKSNSLESDELFKLNKNW